MTAVFIALLAKSSLVAGLALGVCGLLAGRSPAERAALLRAAVVLLVVLPVIALAGPDLTIWLADAAPAATPPEALAIPAAAGPVAGTAPAFSLPDLSTGLALVWAIGAALLLARFGVGILTLARWTRAGEVVSDPAWTAPFARLAGQARPRLIATRRIASPLSWGVPPGVVLIGADQLDRPRDAEAVLAHELAHIRRHDWLFLGLSRVAVALFWFNPLVWLLQAELARLSEDAADADALRHVDRETYARTLLGLAAGFTPVAAAGMTGPARSLAKRITRVMTQRRPASPRPLAMMAAVGALLVVATPLAAVELSVRAAPPAPPAPAVPYAALAPIAGSQTFAPPLPAPPPAPPEPPAPPAPPAPPEAPARYGFTSWDGRYTAFGQDGEERRAAVAAAREATIHARAAAGEARAHATQARAMARADASVARQAERAAAHARTAAEHAARAHAAADEMRVQAGRQMAEARVQMRVGADQMVDGARNMREEARKLRDPAYRAEQIARARERGQTVTDQDLLDAIPKMETGADNMEAGAARMREQAANPG